MSIMYQWSIFKKNGSHHRSNLLFILDNWRYRMQKSKSPFGNDVWSGDCPVLLSVHYQNLNLNLTSHFPPT